MESAGVAVLIVSSAAALVGAFPLRERLPRRWGDLLLALAGAGLGIGGVMLLDDPAPDTWILAPAALAAMTVIHVRALFAREGPMRTHR